MKTRVYLRLGKTSKGLRVVATSKPTHAPLTDTSSGYLPTIAFAIDLDLPSEAFKAAEHVIATLTIPESAIDIAADVVQHDA